LSYLGLNHYGVIGNHQSVAIVSRFGSIDWCCLPDLDSPSHFGSLLDETYGGRFEISPVGDFHSKQHYLQRTLVLETTFETPFGRAVLTDWMPLPGVDEVQHPTPLICRRIEVMSGKVQWNLRCSPRFDYGSRLPVAEIRQGGVLFRGTAPDEIAQLVFDDLTRVNLTITEKGTTAEAKITLEAGQSLQIGWLWGRLPPPREFPSPDQTIEIWHEQAHRCASKECQFAGPWHDAASRSGLLLKLLCSNAFGSLAAGATTSLPGRTSARTRDYRFAWVRDNAEACTLLSKFGYREEATRSLRWITDILLRDAPEDLQPVYTIDGGRVLPERELAHLSGYQENRPVRLGNDSARSLELDIYGRILYCIKNFYEHFGFMPPEIWNQVAALADTVCQIWKRPDQGPWSSRLAPKHYVSSKAYCWLALDCALKIAASLKQPLPHRWIEEKSIIHRTICEQGFDPKLGSFVQCFGSRDLDASVLDLMMIGFLPAEDLRIHSTVDAIRANLCDGVLVHRYHCDDGSAGSEGAHLPSSFLLTSVLSRIGKVEESVDRLAELCTYATPVGLLGEQVNEATGETSGNFPCASSHLALIQASLEVSAARTQANRGGLTTLPFREEVTEPSKFSLKRLSKLRYR
jgi:GH15 family glucan-1,4-alpha-glucosidase